MKQLEQRLYALGKTGPVPDPGAVASAVRRAQQEYYVNQSEGRLPYSDFLRAQARTVRKGWWLLQAGLLLLLWCSMEAVSDVPALRRMTTVFMPLFVLAAVPELWKNLREQAIEVENAAYYTLRQIYSARLTVFAVVDLTLLTLFCALAVGTGRIVLAQVLTEFLLPFTVTCCICFRVLCARKYRSEALAMVLCMVWTVLWSRLVLDNDLYARISGPVWAGLLLAAMGYLAVCVRRTLHQTHDWSESVTWN